MPANETLLITVIARVDANPALVGQTLTNTANVNATNDGDPRNNTATADVRVEGGPVAAAADIIVTKKADTQGGTIGKELSYTITIRNNGAFDSRVKADLSQILDALPASITFVSAVPSRGTCSAGLALTCDFGTLKPAEGATVRVTVIPNVADYITNVATGVSSTPDSNPGNNTGIATVPIARSESDLRLKKIASKTRVAAGGKIGYRVIVKNTGNATALNVLVCDKLPVGLAFISIQRGGTFRNGQACWLAGDLPPGAVRGYAMLVRVATTAKGLVRNTAVATSANTPRRTATNLVRVSKTNLAIKSRVTG